METYMKESSFVGVGDRFIALEALRAGDTNRAIDELEGQMNGEILVFAGINNDVPVGKLQPGVVRLITKVRNYREAHPYTEDPDIDSTVASILSLTNTSVWPNTALAPAATAP
jgi:hypothetical protein